MKISFLASHGGTAAKHIIAAIRSNQLAAEIGVVITNNPDSVIYNWCNDNAVETVCINGNTHLDEAERDKAIYDKLLNANNLDEWMKYMTARPHHVGSPYDKKVVDFVAAKFKEWGYEVAKNEFNAKVNDLGFYEIPTNQKIDAINKKIIIKWQFFCININAMLSC